jgi:nitrate reductase gamma subunit
MVFEPANDPDFFSPVQSENYHTVKLGLGGDHRLMPRTIPILIILALLCPSFSAQASWLIDEPRWHVSAHGQVSCRDCHGDIGREGLHPDPTAVNAILGDFFRLDQCIGCHDEVMDNLRRGIHGSLKDLSPQDYSYCIRCHDPHYQLNLTNPPGKYDASVAPDRQCATCHEPRNRLPELSREEEACMSCHRRLEPQDARAAGKVESLCFFCHAVDGGLIPSARSPSLPLLNSRTYPASPHSQLSCLICHLRSAQFKHDSQALSDCRECHPRHDEKVAHDAHLSVTCEACHLRQIVPKKDETSGTIRWSLVRKPEEPSQLHNMISENSDSFCRRCHFSGNTLGAAAVVLPPKSLLCMPCHAATFSVSDATTIATLTVFIVGLIGSFSFWLSGTLGSGIREAGAFVQAGRLMSRVLRTIFSKKIAPVISALVLDGLLQRRLYRQSKSRWLIHGLIFYPFGFRFCWGLVALLASLLHPQGSLAWTMLDKNNPLTAFGFDLSGVVVLVGITIALLRAVFRRAQKIPGLPHHDFPALGLIAAIFVVGFVLEGMRIAMTGDPPGSEYAFVGFMIGRIFRDAASLVDIFGYVWYVHAILTGAFIAYLPFSRMFHILLAPVVAAMHAVSQQESGNNHRNRQLEDRP